MRWLVLLVVVAGCGRIGFGGFDGGAGGGGDDAPGGGGGDGAIDTLMIDATISPGCGATVILDDPFMTAGNGAFTPVNTNMFSMMEAVGVLRINVPAGAPANARTGMQQTASQSFVGTCAIAELSMSGSGANVRAYLRLGLPAKNVEMYVQNGQLFGRFNVMATTGTIGPATYNAAAMRFLRMREIGNRNYAVEYGASLTGPFQMMGSQGGSFADPSPSSIEVGVFMAGDGGSSTVVEFERVLLLGP